MEKFSETPHRAPLANTLSKAISTVINDQVWKKEYFGTDFVKLKHFWSPTEKCANFIHFTALTPKLLPLRPKSTLCAAMNTLKTNCGKSIIHEGGLLKRFSHFEFERAILRPYNVGLPCFVHIHACLVSLDKRLKQRRKHKNTTSHAKSNPKNITRGRGR